MPEQSLVWVYAITPSAKQQLAIGISGLAGARLRAVGAAGLAAVVSTVDAATFGQQALRRNLEDLDWLASVARRHDAVIRAVTEQGPVIPLRLGTIYASDEHVRRVLRQRHPELAAALRTVSGRSEWGVKAYTNSESDDASRGPADSGIAYVRRRRAQLAAREDAERVAGRQAQAVHAALTSLAVAARTHAPRNTALDQNPGREVLNGAYLVDGPRTAAFHDAVRLQEQSNRAVRLILTGPWPPYSFTTWDKAPT
jgi:gas vesicle protein GvpL/GvpF